MQRQLGNLPGLGEAAAMPPSGGLALRAAVSEFGELHRQAIVFPSIQSQRTKTGKPTVSRSALPRAQTPATTDRSVF